MEKEEEIKKLQKKLNRYDVDDTIGLGLFIGLFVLLAIPSSVFNNLWLLFLEAIPVSFYIRLVLLNTRLSNQLDKLQREVSMNKISLNKENLIERLQEFSPESKIGIYNNGYDSGLIIYPKTGPEVKIPVRILKKNLDI